MNDDISRTPDPTTGPLTVDPATLDLRTRRAVVRADLADRTADRDADRRARTRRARADHRRADRSARDADRERTREDRRKVRAERSARRREWTAARIDYARTNAPAVYSAVIYGTALGVAVTGQVTAATAQGWPVIVGVGIAVFVEGMALTMALTAHQLRMKKERGLVPRALTWVCASFAAGVNFFAHDADLLLALVLAASSLAAITVWEVRSGAKNRPTLRRIGAIPEPPERFGWRRWLRYPWSTFAGWSADIRDRVTPRAADLLASVEVRKSTRRADRDRRRLVRAAVHAVRDSGRRGPSEALDALRTAVDLIAGPPVRVDPGRVRPPKADRPTDRSTDRSADHGPTVDPDRHDPHADPSTDRPTRTAPEQTNVRRIDRADGDERLLHLVRTAHPQGRVAFGQVNAALAPHLAAMGLSPSKSRVKRVMTKILAERGLDDQERLMAGASA